MKKFLDTFVLKSIWRQLFLAFLVGFIVIVLSTPIARFFLEPKSLYSNFHSSWLWSLLHLCDGGFIASTITTAHASADETAGNIAMVSSFILWLFGAVLLCFITGAISNAFEVRKDKIASGLVRYKFTGGHGIIIGWDFQGPAIVTAMRELFYCKEIVILSSQSAEDIRSELENILSEREMKNIFIHKGNVFDKNELKQLLPYEAECVFILGDQNENNNDGGNAKIRTLMPVLPEDQLEKKWRRKRKVPCFVDISNPYNLAAEEFDIHTQSETSKMYTYRVFNFYKQSVNELLGSIFSIYSANKGNRKGVYEYDYSPLAYRRNPEASHVHLMVTGFDDMAHMYIIQAIKTLQPSKEPHKISIFSDDEKSIAHFFGFYDFDALQNIKIQHYPGSIYSRQNRELVKSIVQDLSASVSLLIADPCPSQALEVFHSLPPELNFENIRIIIEQQLMTENARRTYTLRRKGYASVDYIGLLDKFYYPLLKQDEFVDQIVGCVDIDMEASLLKNICRNFADTILEKIYRLELKFDEIVDEKCAAPQVTDMNSYIEELAMADQQNYFNSQILNGYKYDVQSNDRHFFCSIMKPWSELSEEEKGIFRNKVSSILPAIGEMFGKENGIYKSFGVLEHKFRWVCGFIDNSENKFNWLTGNSANNLYQNLIFQLKIFNLSSIYTDRIYKQSQKHDRYRSLAVLCTLEDNGNSMFLDMACRDKIPVIAILPMPPEKYQYNFAEGFCRNEFWRRLRNVYTYYVIPDDVKNTKEYISEVIAKYSDEIWHIGQFEVPNDTGACVRGEVKYISRRLDVPMLREIKIDGPITRETQVLFPAYYEKEKKPVKKNAKMVIKKFLTRITVFKQ